MAVKGVASSLGEGNARRSSVDYLRSAEAEGLEDELNGVGTWLTGATGDLRMLCTGSAGQGTLAIPLVERIEDYAGRLRSRLPDAAGLRSWFGL